MICEKCSAQGVIQCDNALCNKWYCRIHATEHLHMRGTRRLEDIITGLHVDHTRRQIGRRGDFAIDKQVVGEQGERRYFLCGPDEANQGITLANLEALWHLIGETIIAEKK